MALTRRQGRFYDHTMSVYRFAREEVDDLGNPLAGSSPDPVAGLQDLPCNYRSTFQTDTRRAPGVKLNQDNLETLDEVRFEVVHDVRERDLLRIESPSGAVDWYRVSGAPRRREGRANSAHVLVFRTPAPSGLS